MNIYLLKCGIFQQNRNLLFYKQMVKLEISLYTFSVTLLCYTRKYIVSSLIVHIIYRNLFLTQQITHIVLILFYFSFFYEQVIIDGIGIFNICLGNDFASSGFLHSSLYLLLENLICPNFQIRRACDAILHVLATTSGYSTVSKLCTTFNSCLFLCSMTILTWFSGR